MGTHPSSPIPIGHSRLMRGTKTLTRAYSRIRTNICSSIPVRHARLGRSSKTVRCPARTPETQTHFRASFSATVPIRHTRFLGNTKAIAGIWCSLSTHSRTTVPIGHTRFCGSFHTICGAIPLCVFTNSIAPIPTRHTESRHFIQAVFVFVRIASRSLCLAGYTNIPNRQ